MEKVQPDFLFMWELVCSNKGPMISPRMWRDCFMEPTKRVIAKTKEMGMRNVWVDLQGNNWDMLPLFMECGVTGTLPLEVHGGMDAVAVRRRYPRLQLIGNVERMALVRGPAAIRKELDRVAPLVPLGGYIPSVDHFLSPDISWDNFVCFIEELRRITSVPIRPKSS
jgi:uroporphyrinogen decarboxylase